MNKKIIIAEIGVNHDGSFNKAKKMISIAKKIGADVIKLQYFKAENLAIKDLKLAEYQKKNTKYKSQFNMLKSLELEEKQIIKLSEYCKKIKIKFCLSFFSHLDLDIIKKIKLDYIKIPSGEINNLILIKELSGFKKKFIISTGMSNYSEIQKCLEIIISNINKNDISILQCTSSYPAPFKDLNLGVIKKFKDKFKINSGFSDHSIGIEASIAAVAIGAKVIEKHFTLDKKDYGPDHTASLDPKEFKKLVISIRNVEKSIGDRKYNTPSEKKNFKLIRKKIVAKHEISKNEIITLDKINIKRTNSNQGYNPDKIFLIINKKSKKNYKKDEKI